MFTLVDAEEKALRTVHVDEELRAACQQRVLLVIDRSDETEPAISTMLARSRGALDLIVLKLLPPWYSRRLEVGTRVHLARLGHRLTSTAVHVTTEVRRGEPLSDVLAVAEHHRVHVIAMPSHHRGLLDRLFDTTLASAVRRAAAVPVEILPKPLSRPVPRIAQRLA